MESPTQAQRRGAASDRRRLWSLTGLLVRIRHSKTDQEGERAAVGRLPDSAGAWTAATNLLLIGSPLI